MNKRIWIPVIVILVLGAGILWFRMQNGSQNQTSLNATPTTTSACMSDATNYVNFQRQQAKKEVAMNAMPAMKNMKMPPSTGLSKAVIQLQKSFFYPQLQTCVTEISEVLTVKSRIIHTQQIFTGSNFAIVGQFSIPDAYQTDFETDIRTGKTIHSITSGGWRIYSVSMGLN